MKDNIKVTLLVSIFSFVFALIPIFIFCSSIRDYNFSKIEYQDLIYKEFTVENIEIDLDAEMGDTYYISICEEEKIIKINNLLTKSDVNKKLQSLYKGAKIQCFLIEDSTIYNAVEIKNGQNYILSLERYSEIYRNNGIGGMIIMPILFIVCIFFGTKGLVMYCKEKNKNLFKE